MKLTPPLFADLEMAAPDPILSLNSLFQSDPNPNKTNLAIGVYLDAQGRVPLLQAVQKAAKSRFEAGLPYVYLPIDGNAIYNRSVKKLLFVDNKVTEQIVTVQAPGGTGALTVGARLLQNLRPGATVAISNPSWENHRQIFESFGFNVVEYPYYDPKTHGIDFDNLLSFLYKLAPSSIVILHACCHNPTGNDLNFSQWQEIITCCQKQALIPFLDMAYQGFAASLDEDKEVLNLFVQSGLPVLTASSFSKNFSLYGERVGALSIVTDSPEQSNIVLSQVKRLIRATYSNPPSHGAALISEILNSPELTSLWQQELATMRSRIKTMRSQMVEQLSALVPDRDFSFIEHQKGMFSYLGLEPSQMERLRTEHSIYALLTSRLCIAALTENNIQRVTQAIADVIHLN